MISNTNPLEMLFDTIVAMWNPSNCLFPHTQLIKILAKIRLTMRFSFALSLFQTQTHA